MIRQSKETDESTEILIFDVRDSTIAKERGLPPKVYLGKIYPEGKRFVWESAWGGHRGDTQSIDRCQYWITVCAKGMYK